MLKFTRIAASVAVVALMAGLGPAQAQSSFTDRTERLQLEGRRGPSLLQPGFAVGEYVGSASGRTRSLRAPLHRSQMSSVDFIVAAPGLNGEVQGQCQGGEAHTRLLWIDFQRDDLAYVCTFGGAAPADARLSLALARGSLLGRLQQPQRAGEMVWGGRTYRFQTRQVGALPWAGGRTLGYVVSLDGEDVGGVALGGMRPTFYLPPAGDPNRDAVAILTLSLFHFRDPANDNR